MAEEVKRGLGPIEARLDEAEAALEEIATAIEEIVAITSADGRRQLYLSPAYEVITGWPRDEVLADPLHFLRIVHPDDHEILRDAHRKKDERHAYEVRIRRPDGEERRLQTRAFPVRGPGGSVDRIVTLTRDVTAQRLAEARAGEQRRLVEAVATSLTTVLGAGDPTSAIDEALAKIGRAAHVDRVYVARHHCETASNTLRVALTHEWTSEGTPALLGSHETSGRRPAMPASRPFLDALARGETLAVVTSSLPSPVRERIEASGARSILVVPICVEGHCWGQVGFADCRSERAWDAAERAILETTAAALGSVVARQRTMAALEEQVARVRALHEAVADPKLPVDEQLQRSLAVGARLLGVEMVCVLRVRPEDRETCELVSVHPPEAPVRPGDRLPLTRDLWDRSVHEDRAVSLQDAVGTEFEDHPSHIQHGLRSFLGAPLWVRGVPWGGIAFLSTVARPQPFEETDHAFARLIAHDVSVMLEHLESKRERAELETRFREAQKLESLGLLAGGIAHDFNNLLMGVMGNASLALRELSPGRARDCVEQIITATERAADLTRQMLAYSGRAPFRIEAVRVESLMDEMARLLEASLPKDVTLERRYEEELPPILADRTQLQQVIMNLITNAADASRGPSTITLRVRAEDTLGGPAAARFVAEDAPPGPYVVLEVADSGEGMDPLTLERMFEPFFTTKRQGRGLGLAAVLGIVRSHRGALDVTSVRGRGTTFTVRLPAAISEPNVERSARENEPSWRIDGRVLVVEDTRQVQETLRRVLEWNGASVVTADDGLEAVARVREDPARFDAVLLDLTMPRMDGVAAHEQIRQLEPSVPIVVMSGYSSDERVAGILAHPKTRFIPKPFRSEELLAALRAAIEARSP